MHKDHQLIRRLVTALRAARQEIIETQEYISPRVERLERRLHDAQGEIREAQAQARQDEIER